SAIAGKQIKTNRLLLTTWNLAQLERFHLNVRRQLAHIHDLNVSHCMQRNGMPFVGHLSDNSRKSAFWIKCQHMIANRESVKTDPWPFRQIHLFSQSTSLPYTYSGNGPSNEYSGQGNPTSFTIISSLLLLCGAVFAKYGIWNLYDGPCDWR